MDHFSDIDDRDTREWLEPDMEDDFRDYAYRDELYVPRRLRHQVLVDGRLVDSRTEPVEGTRWERHASGLRCPARVPSPPSPAPSTPPSVRGGARLARGAGRWPAATRPPRRRPPGGAVAAGARGSVGRCRARSRGAPSRLGGRRAVLRRRCPTSTPSGPAARVERQSRPRPARKVGPARSRGICWAVARANGWFHPHTNVRQKEVQRHLWLTSTISAVGGPVVRALRDLGPRPGPCPTDYPDLLALGHPDLLTATTRLQLIGWRDKATAARDAYGPPPADDATTTTGGRLS